VKLGRIWLRSAGREAVKLFGWLAGWLLPFALVGAHTRFSAGRSRRRIEDSKRGLGLPFSRGRSRSTIDHADRKGDANPTASLGQGGPAGGRAWGWRAAAAEPAGPVTVTTAWPGTELSGSRPVADAVGPPPRSRCPSFFHGGRACRSCLVSRRPTTVSMRYLQCWSCYVIKQ
jgi:hypothetical protein